MNGFEQYKKDMAKIKLWVRSEWDFHDQVCEKQPQTQILTAYCSGRMVDCVEIHKFVHTICSFTVVVWRPYPTHTMTRRFINHEEAWRFAWRRLMRVKG
jgi:hypothetical protein